MSFGKPKGKHHSANQVRQGYKQRTGRRSRKNICPFCGRNMTATHNKENPDHVRP